MTVPLPALSAPPPPPPAASSALEVTVAFRALADSLALPVLLALLVALHVFALAVAVALRDAVGLVLTLTLARAERESESSPACERDGFGDALVDAEPARPAPPFPPAAPPPLVLGLDDALRVTLTDCEANADTLALLLATREPERASEMV